jgi:Fanconi anemia group M protein
MGSSVCAQALKLSHLIELLETQTLYTAQNYIKGLFEQANQNKSKAVKRITSNQEFNNAYISLNQLIAKNLEHPKLLELKEIITNSIEENPKNKTIVFSQYRDTTTKIAKELNKIKGINAKTFVGQNKKNGQGLSQKEQQEVMNEFREGEINIIAATSIAEEGLDIPEVNSVIFYEPIPSAIRQIQRRGRTARLMKGKLVILITNDTLDEIFYYASGAKEKRMHKAIQNIKDKLDKGEELKIKSKNQQKTLF